MNKKITLFAVSLCLFFSISNAQISITNSTPYTQDFNTLPTNAPSTANPSPANWVRYAPSAGTATINVTSGTSNAGGFYSTGTGTNTERSLGSLNSASARQLYSGVKFVNNTGSTIVSAMVSYKCEQWRRGNTNAGLFDTLLFEYTNITDSIHKGTWTNVPALVGSSTNTSSTMSALDGNTVFKNISGTISGLAVVNGGTFWIRFSDFDVSPGSDDILSVDDFSIAFTTGTVVACTEPAGSVTNVVLNQTGSASVSGSFIGTSPASDGYVVLLDSNATIPTITDATIYTVGQSVGTSTVISVGTSTTFNKSGLVQNTNYKVYVFPYNNASCSGGPNYKTTLPGTANATTLVNACPEPTTKPTNLVFSLVNNTTITGKFNKSVPAPTGGYVVVYSTSSSIGYPLDTAVYVIGDSIKVGSNKSKVAYVGADSNFTVSSLVAGTKYYFAVIPYNNCPFGPNYFRTSPLRDDTTTTGGIVTCNAPDTIKSITVGALTANSISGSFVPSTTNPADSFLVIYRKSRFLAQPRDSVNYTVGGFYTQIFGANTDTSYVAAKLPGSATTFTISGLANNTTYHFAVIPYKACAGFPNYNLKISTASNKASATLGSVSVICTAPDTIRGVTNITTNSNSISGNFGLPTTGADGYVVIYRKSSFLATPSDSITYTVGQVITKISGTFTDSSTIGFVGTIGTSNAFTITGLSPNTKYYFAVIPYKTCTYGPNYNLKIGQSNSTNSNRGIATTALATGIKTRNAEAEFSIYPNPTNTGLLSVKFSNLLKEDAVIEVIDILGQKLTAQKISNGTGFQTIDVSNFAKGNYILNVVYKGENNVSTFIVQ